MWTPTVLRQFLELAEDSDHCPALVENGDSNSAIASDGGTAEAGNGDSNSAIADGTASAAAAHSGNNNSAIASNGGLAEAEGETGFACSDEPDEIAINVDLCAP